MIRHIVFFSAKSPDKVAAICSGLEMLAAIPSVSKFEVARNQKCDQIGNAVDVVVYAEFANEEALSAYRSHPLYAKCISIVRPLREMRLAADFIATGTTPFLKPAIKSPSLADATP